ncbi:17303_t:CDS:2, partial [Gigaspora rosea]
IPSHVPKQIARLIMKCWDARPSKRLTSKEAYNTIKMLYNEILKDDPTENIDQINKCGNETDNSLAPNLSTKFYYKLHPGAIYTSRLLDFFDLPSPMNALDYDKQFEELECYTLNDDVQYLPKESDGLLLEAIVNEK